jgi:RNA polymerase sigma factor (sigma-70 family)
VGQSTTPALDDFVRRIRPSLVSGLARITSDVAVAEGLAHEAIEVVVANWSTVATDDSPAAWTWRVALNRNAKRHRRIEIERRHFASQAGPSSDRLVEATPDDQLDSAVATLPVRHRVVVVLRVHLGYTYAEIADIVGCSPLYARQMCSRSTARLRSLLGEAAHHG